MTEIKKDNKVIIKNGKNIIGFIEIKGNKFLYAFCKPSESQYIAFETDTLEKARNRILQNYFEFHMAFSA